MNGSLALPAKDSPLTLRLMQQKQSAWAWQWKHLTDDNQWLFEEWIEPNTLDTFRGKHVLDCGCGGGQHVSFVSPHATTVTGVDLNALESARERTKSLTNVSLVEADIATMDLQRQFDVAYCIGVLHHTDNPDGSFRNIAKHVRLGGRVIVWIYSREGNWINEYILEPVKFMFIRWLPRWIVMGLAHLLTMLLYVPVYSLYLLPLTFLPFHAYFRNWRRLSYGRNMLNVFDKLNAPQTDFISRERVTSWFPEDQFTDVHISPYKGVSWRASGTKIA